MIDREKMLKQHPYYIDGKREPEMIESEYCYIMPHNRDKGEVGYVIHPKQNYGFNLNGAEMSLVIAVYGELLRRKAET